MGLQYFVLLICICSDCSVGPRITTETINYKLAVYYKFIEMLITIRRIEFKPHFVERIVKESILTAIISLVLLCNSEEYI